jgi:TonB family protein
MVFTWRWRRRQPANLSLYVGFSLALHGLALLTLQWVDPVLERKPTAELPPIEIVDAPKVEWDQPPPPETPNRSDQNTVAQGTVRPDVPQNLETTRRTTASISQSPAVSLPEPQPSPVVQATPEPLPKPVVPPEPRPQPSPVAQATPESLPKPVVPPEPRPQPSSTTQVTPEPLPKPVVPPEPQPSSMAQATPEPLPKPVVPPEPRPQPSPVAQATPESLPKPVVPPEPRPQPSSTTQVTPEPRLPRSTPPVSQPSPSVAVTPPKPTGQAALLGGTLSRDARQAAWDQEANTTRHAPGPTQLAARQDFDLGPYLANLRRRVQERWRPNAPDQQRQAVIGFTISRNGEIANMRILKSSGSPQTDAETILAIQQAAPFGPLPEQFPYNQLNIEFTFNIYVNNSAIPSPRSWYGF